MKKILFLTSYHYPNYYVNGLCVNEVIKKLKKDYEIYVLSYQNFDEEKYYEDNNIKIFKVRPRIFFFLREYGIRGNIVPLKKISALLAKIIQKFKRVIFFPFYPATSIIATKRYTNMAKQIVKKYDIDAVISVFKPFESLKAGKAIKKENPNIKFIMYVLDSLSDEKNSNNIFHKYERYRGQKWEKYFYQDADLIINMRSHEKSFQKSYYDEYRSKMLFSDIPLFRKLSGSDALNDFNDEEINLVYTGTLDKIRRNPSYVCNLIKYINKEKMLNKKIIGHFYSRGSCENILAEYAKSNSIIKQHGYVKNEISVSALINSNAIMSIEYADSSMISAKIFEYMSTGKKIIHFYTKDTDILLNYFKKYPNILLINENDNLKDNAEKVSKFLKAKENKTNYDKISEIFAENTPEYTANIIKKSLESK